MRARAQNSSSTRFPAKAGTHARARRVSLALARPVALRYGLAGVTLLLCCGLLRQGPPRRKFLEQVQPVKLAVEVVAPLPHVTPEHEGELGGSPVAIPVIDKILESDVCEIDLLVGHF